MNRKRRDTQEPSVDPLLKDADDNDIVILIIGITGVGKSTFLNTLVEPANTVEVGHGLTSCTTKIQYRCIPSRNDPTRRLVLVDTPGLDGVDSEDSDILSRIMNWLMNSYGCKKFEGIIYLQDLSHCRDVGWEKTLAQIRNLCDEGKTSKIVLATTKWAHIHQNEGEKREHQLSAIWQPIGARVVRFSDTEESARNIISIVTTRLPTDNMILILGQSGAGKSSFINTAADRDVAKVGHGLESCTRKVESIFVQHPHDAGRRVIFVDTPGFNDSQTGDVEILRCIVDWLRSHEWLSLTGIVYLQEITQTRSGPEKDLMAPEKLGRSGAAHNTVLVTTKWDEIAPEEGERRESQRSETHWKAMIDRGLRMTRFSDTHKSAWEIVDLLLRQDAVSAEEELTFVLTKLLHLELKNSNIPPPERSQGSFIARLLALLFRK